MSSSESGVNLIKKKVATLKQELDDCQSRAQEAEEQLNNQQEIIEKLENDLKAAHQKLSLTEDELDKAETSVQELTTRAETAEKAAEEAERTMKVFEESLYKEQAKCEEFETDLTALKVSHHELEEKYADAERKLQNDDLEDRLEDLENQTEELTQQNDDLEAKFDESCRKIKMLEDDLAKAEEKTEVFENKTKEDEIELTNINNAMKKMEAAEGLQSEREDKLEVSIRDLEAAKSDLSIRAENAERQIQVLEENILKLEKVRDMVFPAKEQLVKLLSDMAEERELEILGMERYNLSLLAEREAYLQECKKEKFNANKEYSLKQKSFKS